MERSAPAAANGPRHRSSATPLAVAYAVLIVYASLYPFTGWRVPSAVSGVDWLLLPWPAFWARFDAWSNLVGYLPLGMLACGALLRSGVDERRTALLTLAAGAGLSFTLEVLQNFLPQRVPSRMDWMLNAAGAACGLLLAMAMHRRRWIERWQSMRDRWFIRRSAGALALLLLWPVALLFPPPVPLGLGHAIVRIPQLLADAAADTIMEPWVAAWAEGWNRDSFAPLTPAAEALTILLGLLAPCLVAFSVARPGWRRVVLAVGAAALGFAATTLSTLLNFGPQHLLAWQTGAVAPAFVLGMFLAAVLAWVPGRAAAGLGLVTLTALVALVAQAPGDPYYAESLQSWEQGRFIRFHGAAQWIGWLWPYAAMLYLLARIGSRGRD